VVAELAAAVGENRRAVDQACALLLAEGHLTRRLFAGMLRPSPAG
jgi:predicted regulator of amino acid metabolism with ACT domain